MRTTHLLGYLLLLASLLVAPFSFAQEEATSTDETEEAVTTMAETEIAIPLTISNVTVEKEAAGTYRVSWLTSDNAAGAVTYLTGAETGGIQHRLTNGKFSKQHQYLITGLGDGSQAVLIESVGTDLAYARKAIEINVPMQSRSTGSSSSLGGLVALFFFLTPLALIVILEEIFRLRRQMREQFEGLAAKVKTAPKKTTTRRKTTRKTSTKKTSAKTEK